MYAGCGTGSNRARWCCAIFCVLATAALWAVSVIERINCMLCDKVDGRTANCRDLPNGRFYQYDDTQVEITECSVLLVAATFLGGAAALLLATIPCFAMCCCAHPPQSNGGRVARSDSSDQGRGYKGDSSHSFRVVSGQTPAAQYKPPVVPVVNKPDLSHLGLDGLPISQPKSPMRASGRGQSPTARMHARVQSGEASPSPSAAYNGARGGMPSGDRPSSQEAVPNWAALGQFAPPVAPVNKPDLSHLGLDGLPISQPKSPMRASRGNQAPTARMHARVQSGDVSPRHPSPCNGTRGGMPSGDRSRSHPQRASSRSRSAAQSTQQQHAMRAASPDINPPRSGSRQHQQCHQQQQQYGMQAVADASPRYSNRSVQALLSPHASSQREGWFTPEGSPRLSSRNNRVSSQNQSYVPDVAPGSASSNPYYPSKMEATVFSDPRAPVLEVDSFAPGESAGLNSFGRPRGLDDPVTPRGRFR